MTKIINSQFKDISFQLSQIVYETIEDILDWIFQRMWRIQSIKSTLGVVDAHKKDLIQSNIEALLNRIGKPTVSLFLEFPRSDGRHNAIKNFKNEMILLDLYYSNTPFDYEPKGLPSYLAIGKWNPDESYQNLNIKLDLDSKEIKEQALNQYKDNYDEIEKEIIEDTETFIDYMKNSVYYASGIEMFVITTVDDLINRFKNLQNEKNTWLNIVLDAYEKGLNIPAEMSIFKKDRSKTKINQTKMMRISIIKALVQLKHFIYFNLFRFKPFSIQNMYFVYNY